MTKAHTQNVWNINRQGSREIWITHDTQFVARFKYANAGKSATHFIKFLTTNFTPAEYLALRETLSPIPVLATKGYVSYNVAQANPRK